MIRPFRFITIVVATHLIWLSSHAQLEPSLLERATTGDATAMHLIGRATTAAGKPVEGYAWFSLAAEYGVETAEKSALFNTLGAAQVTEAARRAEEIRSTQLRGLPPPAKKPSARVIEENRPVVERPAATPQVAPPSVAQHTLDGQVEAQKARIARLEADLAAARAEISAANAKSDEKSSRLEAALAKAGQERDELAAEISNLKRNTQRAEDLLAQMRAQPSLDVQVETQRTQIAKLEMDLVAARDETSAANALADEKSSRLEAALAKAGQERETLSAEIASLRQDRLQAEEARDRIRAEQSAARSKLEADLVAAQAEARVAKQKAGEATKLEAALAQAGRERDALSGEIATLKLDRQRAEESLAQLKARPSLEGQVQQLKAQIAKLETDLAASRSETGAALQKIGENTKLEAALAKAGQEKETLTAEIATLRRDKQRADESLAQLQSRPSIDAQVETQKAQIAKLETDLAASRSEAQAAKARAEESASRLEAALANSSPDRDSHAKEIATLKQERLSAEQARDRMRAELATTRSKLEADLAAARSEARAAKSQVAKLEADLAAARSETRSGEAQTGESTAQLQEALTQANRDLAAEQIRNDNLVRELARARPGVLLASVGTPDLRTAPSRSPAPEFIEVPSPASIVAREHTVAYGENLSVISLRYYNTPNRWQEIFEANRDVMNTPNQLAPGTKLRIP